MCYYLYRGSKKQIAKKNIICYKVILKDTFINNTVKSIWTHFCYKLNKVYDDSKKTEILFLNENSVLGFFIKGTISIGFHSYTTLKKAARLLLSHTACQNVAVAKCIIPKGAKYYVSKKDEEYISDKIIINEILK